MIKKFLVILAFIPFLGFAQTADPGMLPINDWYGLMDYIKNGSYTMTYKTLTSPTLTGASITGGLTLSGNSATNNLFVVSDADSFKVRMYKYLYPLEIEIGNVQKVAFDSAGNAIFAGTVSAAAFSPTTSSAITSSSISVVSDGDSLILNPYQAAYMFALRLGGSNLWEFDTTGVLYGKNSGTISNVTNSSWIFGENSEALSFDFTSNAIGLTSSTGVVALNFGFLIPTDRGRYSVADGDSIINDPGTAKYIWALRLGGSNLWEADTTGLLFGKNGGTLSNVTNNSWILAENSEDLSVDFTSNIVTLTSSTGVVDLKTGALKLTVGATGDPVARVDTLCTAGGLSRFMRFVLGDGTVFYATKDTTKI